MKKILSVIGLGLLVGLMLIPQPAAANTNVGLELSLLVDVSGSIDTTEFNLQRTGYVQAFQSAAVQNAILGGQLGNIAVNLVYWAGAGDQQQALGWTLIDSVASANAFATAINGTARPFASTTAPGSAINFAAPLFASNTFDGLRQVIDVSGDGAQNAGASTIAARNAALAGGIDQINGLVILGEAGLLSWYQNNVQGGTGSFVNSAANFGAFAAAIENKIVAEVVGVPEPGTLLLLGCALAGLYGIRRKIS